MQSGTAEHIDLNVADWGYGIGNETTQIARLISGVNMVFNLAERQIDCEEAAVFLVNIMKMSNIIVIKWDPYLALVICPIVFEVK